VIGSGFESRKWVHATVERERETAIDIDKKQEAQENESIDIVLKHEERE